MFVEVAPYWNVNPATKFKIIFMDGVEVAPYWNVNYDNTYDYIKLHA